MMKEKLQLEINKLSIDLTDATLLPHKREELNQRRDALAKRLKILTDENFNKVVDEMKIINTHIHLVEDKYNCRTVKWLFSISDFLENKLGFNNIAKKIRSHVTTKIHAPVCSIIGNTQVDVPPMPVATISDYDKTVIEQAAVVNDMKRYRDLISS